jgi:hypothetical protein
MTRQTNANLDLSVKQEIQVIESILMLHPAVTYRSFNVALDGEW